jgi:hypothetical protein
MIVVIILSGSGMMTWSYQFDKINIVMSSVWGIHILFPLIFQTGANQVIVSLVRTKRTWTNNTSNKYRKLLFEFISTVNHLLVEFAYFVLCMFQNKYDTFFKKIYQIDTDT